MTQPSASLKVFLYHATGDLPALRALRSRLSADGVDVQWLEDIGQPREAAIRDAVWNSDVVLICLSAEDVTTSSEEIKLVVSAATQKPHGEMFILPIRFEKSDLPESLKRWQALDLFEQDGYEKLMLALKLRAERLGRVLNQKPDWNIPLRWAGEDDALQGEKSNLLVSILMVCVAVLVVALLALWGARVFKAAIATPVPVNVMVQNSTQEALAIVKNRSMTQTAIVLTIRAPVTQTAAMEETLQHPPTPTMQFPTIMALPTELIDPGNIRMVYVPGDNFVIGNKAEAQIVYVKPFYIDKYEVTNALYKVCVVAGACQPPINVGSETHSDYYGNIEFNEYPVINVTWTMANQYCQWRRARLPSEAEWEIAARSIDGRTYPWGENAACTYANYEDAGSACVGDTTAVGTYKEGQSLYGAFDMAGNASEWVNSLYWIYPYSATDGRESTTATGLRVVRGGNWSSPPEEITTFYRQGIDPSVHNLYTGFRCAHGAKL